MTEEIKVDTLVIGSGIAGLFFALRAARLGSVLVITKKECSDSNTNWAQGGIAAVLSPDDNYELHINDTLEAGAGLCNREAVEILVREGPEHVKELMAMGVQFTMKDGKPDLVREGGHSKHRILHVADFTGREMSERCWHALPNIQISKFGNIILLLSSSPSIIYAKKQTTSRATVHMRSIPKHGALRKFSPNSRCWRLVVAGKSISIPLIQRLLQAMA